MEWMDGTKNEFLYKGFGLKIDYFNKTRICSFRCWYSENCEYMTNNQISPGIYDILKNRTTENFTAFSF